MNKTLDQKRAENALNLVNQLRNKAESNPDQQEWNDKYASYVKALPATILMNGLGQAAATLLAAASKKDRESDAHYVLYAELQNWLCRNDETAPYRDRRDLLLEITINDRDSYMRAQAEALSWLTWLKKFAVAYLRKPKGGGE